MSATAVAGFHGYLAIEDPANAGTFIDISLKVHAVTDSPTRDEFDTSTFGQGDKTSIKGMRDSSLSVEYYTDQDLRTLLEAVYNSDAPWRVRYGPEGSTTGNERRTAYYNLSSFGDNANISGVIGGTAAFKRTGSTTIDTF